MKKVLLLLIIYFSMLSPLWVYSGHVGGPIQSLTPIFQDSKFRARLLQARIDRGSEIIAALMELNKDGKTEQYRKTLEVELEEFNDEYPDLERKINSLKKKLEDLQAQEDFQAKSLALLDKISKWKEQLDHAKSLLDRARKDTKIMLEDVVKIRPLSFQAGASYKINQVTLNLKKGRLNEKEIRKITQNIDEADSKLAQATDIVHRVITEQARFGGSYVDWDSGKKEIDRINREIHLSQNSPRP